MTVNVDEDVTNATWSSAPADGEPRSRASHPPTVVSDWPTVVIEARRRTGLGLAEVWAYRELLFFMTWRDVKVRYQQTLLGVAWVVLQPLMMTIVFTVFLGRLARVDSGGIPYPLFAYTALLPWTFFSAALGNGGQSLIANATLVSKVYFPRLIIPGAAVAARLFDFAMSFLLLVGMMVFYRVAPTWKRSRRLRRWRGVPLARGVVAPRPADSSVAFAARRGTSFTASGVRTACRRHVLARRRMDAIPLAGGHHPGIGRGLQLESGLPGTW